MKGFIFLGVFAAPFYFSQTTDSVQVTNIQAVEFTKRTPTAVFLIFTSKPLNRFLKNITIPPKMSEPIVSP